MNENGIQRDHQQEMLKMVIEAQKRIDETQEINPEIVDVNYKFLKFQYSGKWYVAKKVPSMDANSEYQIAKKAYSLLDGHNIVDYGPINIVVPEIIATEKCTYLVSEYMGSTLQSNLYTNKKITITFSHLVSLLKLCYTKGLLYRGLLPRNIILKNNRLFLIDWEDAKFFDSNQNFTYNLLWKTNFLLNWQYIFDLNKLISYINSLPASSENEEPNMLDYEMLVSEICGLSNDSIIEKRKEIMKIVLFAEGPLHQFKSHLSFDGLLMPHDCAHHVADMFGLEIDVVFDLISYIVRKRNEMNFYIMLRCISYYIKTSRQNLDLAKNQILECLAIILIFVEKNKIQFDLLEPYNMFDIYKLNGTEKEHGLRLYNDLKSLSYQSGLKSTVGSDKYLVWNIIKSYLKG